jgi:hypothetical protein
MLEVMNVEGLGLGLVGMQHLLLQLCNGVRMVLSLINL